MSFQYPERLIPPSQNPPPDVFPGVLVARETAEIPGSLKTVPRERQVRRIVRRVLDAFWLDMGFCHNSAAMQQNSAHPLHGYYELRARQNRQMVESGKNGRGDRPLGPALQQDRLAA